MMLGHLTLAGFAELVISSGMVAYLQRTDPGLLRLTAPDAPPWTDAIRPADNARRLPTPRKLWLALAALLILTPIGILAVGGAWGEWSARDFSDPQGRREITAASRNQPPPLAAPPGWSVSPLFGPRRSRTTHPPSSATPPSAIFFPRWWA